MAQLCKGVCQLPPYSLTAKTIYSSIKDEIESKLYFACIKCYKKIKIEKDDPRIKQYPPKFCPCCGCTLKVNHKKKKYNPPSKRNLIENFNKPGKLHQVIKIRDEKNPNKVIAEIVKVVDFNTFFKLEEGEE